MYGTIQGAQLSKKELDMCNRYYPCRGGRVLNLLSSPCGSAGKECACNAGDLGSIPGLGRSPGEGKGYPLQYSGLENSMGCIIVHGVTKSQTRRSDFHSLFLEKLQETVDLVVISRIAANFFSIHD